MKIAMTSDTFLPSTDGVVTRLCASISWLLEEGHEVLVIAPDLGVDNYKGAKVEGIPAIPFMHYRNKKYALPNLKIGSVLGDFGPDVIHVVNPALLGIAGIIYARKEKLPLIASYHVHTPKYADYYHLSFLKPGLWAFFRMLYNRADISLCTSQSVMAELKEKKFRNLHLWKRGVDTNKFHPGQYDEKMRGRLTAGKKNKKLLIYVGRLTAEKEVENIRAALERMPDVCLALVGDGPQREYLEKYFAGTNTVFTGFLHGDELAKAYASADAFVFPSTTETLGLVILEAMASGLPVIAARSGPTMEQVDDGSTGVLYEPTEPEGLTAALSMVQNDELRNQLSIGARKASAHFDWAAPSEQLLGFYRRLLLAKRKPASYPLVTGRKEDSHG